MLDTRKKFPLLYPNLGVAERTSILSNLQSITNTMGRSPIVKVIEPVINELSRIWFYAEEMIHRRGALATSALGIAPIVSSMIKSQFGLNRDIEFYSAASTVEWASPFKAAVSTIAPLHGYSEENYIQLLANAYSGINVGSFPIYVRQTSEILSGLLSINSDISVVDFAKSFKSDDIHRLHKLMHEISSGQYQKTGDTIEIINNFNQDIRRYESKNDRLSEWNISGFVQGFARVAGTIFATQKPKLAIGLASVPLAIWLLDMLKTKGSNSILLGESLDKLTAFLRNTDPGVVLISRLRQKIK
ncbi:hypothetical protein LL037_18730 [Clostridium estertheticum]|uniref:hypothetical protein n=1 Tax=Clostridium estertheticum TaxID=238834 RepID=UPI001C0CABE5|nr:hypothetical protein [Clostridium estertheticum]MBU3198505.1 hypothetical protein [Clostridium estertheticum]WAG64487.1 hypothetical protein LL037_18730 [Clostridium estertheticum]